jgi:hypothetical protein
VLLPPWLHQPSDAPSNSETLLQYVLCVDLVYAATLASDSGDQRDALGKVFSNHIVRFLRMLTIEWSLQQVVMPVKLL